MSAQPLMLVCCEKVLKDITDKTKISMIGLFSGFSARTLPFLSPSMFLVARYGLSQGNFVHHFQIEDSSGNILFRSPDNGFFLDNRTASHTDIAGVEGILFSHPGQYWIKSFLEQEERLSIPLSINYVPMKVKAIPEKNDENKG